MSNNLFDRIYHKYGRVMAIATVHIFPSCVATIIRDYAMATKQEYFRQMLAAFPEDGVGIRFKYHIYSPILIFSIRCEGLFAHIMKFELKYGRGYKSYSWSYAFDKYEHILAISNMKLIHDCQTRGNSIPQDVLIGLLEQIEIAFAEMPIWPTRPIRPSRTCALL